MNTRPTGAETSLDLRTRYIHIGCSCFHVSCLCRYILELPLGPSFCICARVLAVKRETKVRLELTGDF